MSEEYQFTTMENLMIDFLETSHAQKGAIVLALLLLHRDEQK